MTLDSGDTRAALAERAAGHEASPPPPPAAIEAPPSDAAVPAAPAPAAPPSDPGSTPGSPAVGSTPAAVPTQPAAPAAPTDEELRQHALRVAGGEANVPRWIAESNARLAEQAARIKELEARTAAQPTPSPAVPGQPPVPGAVAPVQPEPGSFVAPSPQDVEVIAHTIVRRDPGMNQLQAEYHEAGKLVGDPDRGILGSLGVMPGPGGYVVPALDRRIETIDEWLDPAKAAEIGLAPLDQLQREDMIQAKQQLLAQKRDLIDRYRYTVDRRGQLSRTYQAAFDRARQVVQEDVDERVHEATREAKVTELATDMAKEWPAEFQAATRAAGVDPRHLPKLWERIKLRGKAASVEETENLGPWMTAAVAAELVDFDEYHRLKSGDYARLKEADAAIASGTAPPNTPTPPAPPKVMSYDEQRERTSALLRQRAELRTRRSA